MAVKVQFEIGHTSKLRSKKTPEGFTHDWELYVKGVSGADISCFVEKVVFNLHESFPKPKRVCKEPPYTIQESGYAGFMLPIDIYFRIRDEPKRVQFNYDLDLQQTGPPQHRCDIQKFIFDNPSEEFRLKLLKGGGVPVSGVVPGTVGATMVTSAMATDNHKPLAVTEIKKHKSRSEEAKLPTFTNLFGTPITKGTNSITTPTSLSSVKHSPDLRATVGNPLSSKSSINITNSSGTLSREKSNKDKDKSASSSSDKSRERSERKEKHHKQSANSPHKEARGGDSKRSDSSKHDKRDKNEDKPKKDKSRDKEKERSREKGAITTAQISSSTSVKRLSSPKREISPLKSLQVLNNVSTTLTASTATTHPNARPSSSNGGRLENEQKTSSKLSKDNLNEPSKSRESKKDSSSSGSKRSKREKKDKDKERDKEKKHEDKDKHKPQNPVEVTAAATANVLQIEKASKSIITAATTANSNGTSPDVANSKNRDKTSKVDSKTVERTIDKQNAFSNSTLTVGAGAQTASCLSTNSGNEKPKSSSSNNSSTSNPVPTSGPEKDKRSHKHKKKEKSKDKDRERDKEREREKDKDKDSRKEAKELKDRLDKPTDDKPENFIDTKSSTQLTSSPSLTQNLEETPTQTAITSSGSITNNSSSTATTKKSQNKEKKSREKATSREEKNKHKLQDLNGAGPKTKQTKLSTNQSNVCIAASVTTTKPTIAAATVTTSNVQTNNQKEVSDSGSATQKAVTEQQSLNRNTTLPNKTQSTLQHSDSSNSSFPDLPVKSTNVKQESSKNNAASTKTVKSTKERLGDKSADKVEKEDKKRRRNSVACGNTFIEPPLKQSKKEANKATREKSISPSLRNASTKATMPEVNTFLQPSPSPSSVALTSSNTLPAPPPTTAAPLQATTHSPALNINDTLTSANCAVPLAATTAQQQQSSVVVSTPASQPPPSLATDYWSELQELHHKIMTLQDNEDLQQVVELIASTGCYEITTKTFDFDLCKLDRNTVQRLQDFFATSVS
uniref:YEATS domain-containing protein n=1 Tax=Glossina austeni TaxID=7395 RepID=A0A1A9VG73_GLOAU